MSNAVEKSSPFGIEHATFPRPHHLNPSDTENGSRPVIFISHEKNDPLAAPDYLRKSGTPDAIIETLFTPEGHWRFPASRTVNPYAGDPQTLLRDYLHVTDPIYRASQDSLGFVNWFGYNDHGPLHIQRVGERALSLGIEAGVDVDTLRRTITAAAFHDLGNLVNRDNHSMDSTRIARAIFPALDEDREQLRLIRRAVELHNSSVYRKILGPFADKDAETRLYAMKKIFGEEGLLLFIADKTQFTRERINYKALSPEAISAHKYSEVNLLLETNRIGHVEEGVFFWDLSFRPDIRREEISRYGNISESSSRHESGFKAVASTATCEAFTKDGISYFDSAHHLFWKTSADIVLRTIESAFALYDGEARPRLREFRLSLIDAGARGFEPRNIFLCVTREALDEVFGSIIRDYKK